MDDIFAQIGTPTELPNPRKIAGLPQVARENAERFEVVKKTPFFSLPGRYCRLKLDC